MREDASAGDADYGSIGSGYARFRQAEPVLHERLARALGDARTVLNVGAGAGSYEPADRVVTPVEPSAVMRAERPANLAPALAAQAEALPFPDRHFDASMAISTIHQWRDLQLGLREMRRVTRGPVVIVTSDPDALESWWLSDYAPEVTAVEAARFPAISRVSAALGGATVETIPIPLNCRDGFNEAYYGRPELLLNADARLACSSWSFVSSAVTDRFVETLRRDLADGSWDRRYGQLRRQPFFEGSLRLIVGR